MAPREPEEIFEAALELPPGDRPAFLDRECAGDAGLRAELAAMLELAVREPALLKPPPRRDLHRRIGRYDILGTLGRGGMGEVLEGFDPTLGRRVAIKLLAPALGMPAAAADRLRREARILASLGDERIATLYSLEETDEGTFLTMERVEGRTLADRLREGPLPEPEALAVCAQVARAFEAAHALGIVHRDLKPGNVMLRDDGSVKVIDFGVAKLLGDALPSGPAAAGPGQATLAAGTPAYMSPEQLLGGEITPQTDIWAFGCLLFESLTGRRAVAAETGLGGAAASETATTVEAPVLPAARETQFERVRSAALRRLVRACLAERPQDRPASMTRVREALDRESRSARASRRRVFVAAAAGLVAVAAAVVVGFAFLPGPVVDVQVVGDHVVRGVDSRGRARWTRTFPGGLSALPRVTTDAESHRLVWERDRLRGILVFPNEGAGSVLTWLDPGNGEARWQRPMSWTSPVNERGPARYRWVARFPWPSPDGQVIGAGVVDGVWYSCALQFFALDGTKLGEYSHPGKIFPGGGAYGDSAVGGPLLFWGVNSSARFRRELVPFETSLHPGVLVLLDPANVGGQAYPYSENLPEARDWPAMPRAREAAYLLVPPLDPDLPSAVIGASYTQSNAEGLVIEASLQDQRWLRLDTDLTPRSCYVGPGTRAKELLEGRDSIDVFMVRAERLERVRVRVER